MQRNLLLSAIAFFGLILLPRGAFAETSLAQQYFTTVGTASPTATAVATPAPEVCPVPSISFDVSLDEIDLFSIDSTMNFTAQASLAYARIIGKQECLDTCKSMYPPPRSGGKTDKACQFICNRYFPRGCNSLPYLCKWWAGNRGCYDKYDACIDLYARLCTDE